MHAVYRMLGVSLTDCLRREAEKAWPGPSMELLKNELAGIRKVTCCIRGWTPSARPGPCRRSPRANLPKTALRNALGHKELMPYSKVG